MYTEEKQLQEGLALPTMLLMAELDAVPSIDDLEKAIRDLSIGKSPGTDNIPAECLKANTNCLLPPIYNLFLQCWQQGTVPQNMRNAKIVSLYKNKGDKGDCDNYRGISLLSIVGKAFARIQLKRLQILAERVLPESQCGYRAGRSIVDAIFALKQLQEKCWEQQRPLHAFVDLTKAFNMVSRSGLYRVLEASGCPPTLLKLIQAFHKSMQATIQYDGSNSAIMQLSYQKRCEAGMCPCTHPV